MSYESPLRYWWDSRDNMVMTAYYMRDHGATVVDMALLIEKPWKFTDEYEAAKTEYDEEQARG